MPLRHSELRVVTVHGATARPVFAVDERPRYEAEGVTIRAVIQPLSGSVEARIYGEKSVRMRLMLTTNEALLREGMGVCVDSAAPAACDYRICEPPQRWRGHQRIVLEGIAREGH